MCVARDKGFEDELRGGEWPRTFYKVVRVVWAIRPSAHTIFRSPLQGYYHFRKGVNKAWMPLGRERDRELPTRDRQYDEYMPHGIHVFINPDDAADFAGNKEHVGKEVVAVQCEKEDLIVAGRGAFSPREAAFLKVTITDEEWARMERRYPNLVSEGEEVQ